MQCDCKCDDKVNDVLLRAQFIRGLHDTYTREQLLRIKDLTFQTAIEEALVHEASREDSKELSKSKPSTTSTDDVNRISRRDQQKHKKVNVNARNHIINYHIGQNKKSITEKLASKITVCAVVRTITCQMNVA